MLSGNTVGIKTNDWL